MTQLCISVRRVLPKTADHDEAKKFAAALIQHPGSASASVQSILDVVGESALLLRAWMIASLVTSFNGTEQRSRRGCVSGESGLLG